jgi:hypothetical protein
MGAGFVFAVIGTMMNAGIAALAAAAGVWLGARVLD